MLAQALILHPGRARVKKFALSLLAVLLGATASSAADLAARPYAKAPAPVALVYNWTGFYVGINGGGGSAHKCWDLVNFIVPVIPARPEGCHDATGGTVGGQVGYRWQTTNWVFGVEAQGNWADFRGSNAVVPADATIVSKVDAFGLFTGQIGYAVNSVLFYLKGGAAVVSDKYNVRNIFTGVPTFAGSETRWGGAAGAGIEFGFAPNWSVAIEYDHLFMGRNDVAFTTLPGFGAPPVSSAHRISQDVDIGTVRLNYRFGGPVVAKY